MVSVTAPANAVSRFAMRFFGGPPGGSSIYTGQCLSEGDLNRGWRGVGTGNAASLMLSGVEIRERAPRS